MTSKIKDFVIITTGILAICLGCLMNLYWEDTYKALVYRRVILSETSKTYEKWQKSSEPFLISYYFFNWTNPSDLKNPTYKPEFTEVGPYSFSETTEKVNITWNSNGTVSYRRLRVWHFKPDKSNGTFNDLITTIDPVFVSAAHKTRTQNKFVKGTAFNFPNLLKANLARTKKVNEFLFDGYSDNLLTLARISPLNTDNDIPDKFGWFYEKNGSYAKDGLFNIETGANGMNVFGAARSWNAKRHTGFYPGTCGRVYGSGGDFWPPKTTKEPITIFTPDLCRFLTFEYTGDAQVGDLMGMKYKVGRELVDNGTLNSANSCFCNGDCVPIGALNVSSCRSGAPVFVSYPHFYYADQSYLDALVGLNPDPEKHNIYMVLEPTFGFPLEVAARLQINLLVQPDPDIRLLNGVKKTFFPVFWFEQKVTIKPPKETGTFITIVNILPTAGFITSLVLIIGGILSIVLISYFKCTRSRKKLIISKAKIPNGTKDDPANYGLIKSDYKSNPKQEINANGEDKILTDATPL